MSIKDKDKGENVTLHEDKYIYNTGLVSVQIIKHDTETRTTLAKSQGELKAICDKTRKCDTDVRVPPLENTICCIQNKGCNKENCGRKWIKMERDLLKVSKIAVLQNQRRKFVISGGKANGNQTPRC